MKKTVSGFTIVELLIVIVVIAILAAISIVAYNGIQNRTNDAAIQADLNSTAKKISEYAIINDRYPQGDTQLATLGLKLSKKAYGNHYYNGDSYFNFVYCWPSASNPGSFALIASGVSGKTFAFTGGSVREFPSSVWSGGSVNACSNVGNPIDNGSARDWFYSTDAWKTYVAS